MFKQGGEIANRFSVMFNRGMEGRRERREEREGNGHIVVRFSGGREGGRG